MSRRGDLGTAAVWLVLGAVVAVASWRMDRLRHLDVNPWSVPGLTPGAIGVLMMLFALVLGWRALRAPAASASVEEGRATAAAAATATPAIAPAATAAAPTAAAPAATAPAAAAPALGETRRTLIAGALCVLFAGVSLGRGLPFAVEGAVFVFAFTAIFSWPVWREQGRLGRGLLQALVVSVAAAWFISWLFESVFLVRLP